MLTERLLKPSQKHSFLLFGARGTGKTTLSVVLAPAYIGTR